MFDYVLAPPPDKSRRPRVLTTGVAAVVHVLVIAAAVGLPILYANEKLPDPPDMLAFVVDPPTPPPPPAPPPPAAKEQPKPVKAAAINKPLPVAAPPPAAPIEAPKAIVAEASYQPPAKSGAAVEAGFEGGIAGGVVGGAVGAIETDAPAPPPSPPPPPPPPKPQGPVRVGGQIKAPQLSHRVNPEYPPAAQSAHLEGNVVLEATVGRNGRVESVKVLKSHPLLEAAAIAAVKQWIYQPLNLNGEPMPFILTVTVSFTMQ